MVRIGRVICCGAFHAVSESRHSNRDKVVQVERNRSISDSLVPDVNKRSVEARTI